MNTVKLPDGWHDTELGEVLLSIVGGGTPSKSNASYYQGNIPWMSVKDMNKNVLSDTVDHISQEAVDNSSTNIIPAGTPIIATRMSLGKIIVANFDSAINQDLKALFPADGVFRDFLIAWYRSTSRTIEDLGTGTTVKGIRLEVLKALRFPLPPLAEQKVIADKLDTLLAQVETTKARLERIPEILKRFRQSVLAAAVSGRLTGVKPQRLGKLKDCADIISGLAFKKAQYSENGSRLLQIANVGYGSTKWDSPKYIPMELAENCSEFSMSVGDIVLALNRPITNDTLKVARVLPLDLPATLYQRVARIRCDESVIEPQYLFLIMQSPDFLKLVESNLKGSDQPYLNTSDLATFEISTPKLCEQAGVVRLVEEIFANLNEIEKKSNAALERVKNLTQSILAKAFRGELTADWRAANPELISGDNSAEALLEKIKAERAAMKSKKKTAARKKA